MKEWIVNDFSQEMLKREYSTKEYQPKLVRLWKYYKKSVHRPKVCIESVQKPLNRFYRNRRKNMRSKNSYLFFDDGDSETSSVRETKK